MRKKINNKNKKRQAPNYVTKNLPLLTDLFKLAKSILELCFAIIKHI